MPKHDKLLQAVLGGRRDRNIRFADLCRLIEALGFDGRVSGSHRIFTRDGVDEIINIQPLPGGEAKLYQVKQVRGIITKYRLGIDA